MRVAHSIKWNKKKLKRIFTIKNGNLILELLLQSLTVFFIESTIDDFSLFGITKQVIAKKLSNQLGGRIRFPFAYIIMQAYLFLVFQ